jgi:hypothetical protein
MSGAAKDPKNPPVTYELDEETYLALVDAAEALRQNVGIFTRLLQSAKPRLTSTAGQIVQLRRVK